MAASGIDARIADSGPASADVRPHHSSNEAARSGTESSLDPHVGQARVVEQARAARRRRRARTGPGSRAAAPAPRVCALTTSITRPSHGLRSRAAHTATATRPPGRSTRRISATARAGLEREHEALAAQHDVVGGVGLVDALEVEAADGDVAQAQLGGARGGDRGHLLGDVGEDDLAAGPDALGRREPQPARPAGELEDAVAGAHLRQLEHPLRAPRPARVGVVGVLAPSPRRRRPTCRRVARAARRARPTAPPSSLSLLIVDPQVVFATRCMY